MSWSVMGAGDATEVTEKLRKDFEPIIGTEKSTGYLTGPEHAICTAAANLIMQTLRGYSGTKVSVSANGHAGINVDSRYQNLNISIQPKVGG